MRLALGIDQDAGDQKAGENKEQIDANIKRLKQLEQGHAGLACVDVCAAKR